MGPLLPPLSGWIGVIRSEQRRTAPHRAQPSKGREIVQARPPLLYLICRTGSPLCR